MAESINARETVRAMVIEPFRDLIPMPQGVTLRKLALEYYGSADDWATIADANGLTSSEVAPGTMLLIPQKSSPGIGSSA
jgi:hypothetical protein